MGTHIFAEPLCIVLIEDRTPVPQGWLVCEVVRVQHHVNVGGRAWSGEILHNQENSYHE
ncbi:hypothetical protein DPMN_141472 [Dreissena polymorpha]|uniref:Uncharacterized protein n=1 Tax=Dreissena polymorpha TaxID=45954 RepID=A0A9D4G9J2_DREPO|nr:hypothetical protein DPMN_141472 [Dreissena polymorpha]